MNLPGKLREIIACAVYPVLLATSLVLASQLLGARLPPGLVTTGVYLATLLVVAALEQVLPHERDWGPRGRDVVQDVAYLGAAAVMQSLARALVHLLAVFAALALVDRLEPQPWARGWPAWAGAALALAASDLGKYGLHRLAHEHPWLWRFHAEHHAPTKMYALNGARLHPVNHLWNMTLDVAIPLALGLGGPAIVLAAVFRGTVSVLQHANVEMHTGLLDTILSTPAMHQWHHSSDLEEAHANYGSTFIVWDALFATRRRPARGRAPLALGLAGGEHHPRALADQLVWPWCERGERRCGETVGGDAASSSS